MAGSARPTRNTGQSRDALRAWLGVALAPVGCLLGVGVSALLAYLLEFEPYEAPWWGGDDPWLFPVIVLPALILWMLAPAFGLWHGLRARRAGSGSGTAAAVIAGALLTVFTAYGLLVFLTF